MASVIPDLPRPRAIPPADWEKARRLTASCSRSLCRRLPHWVDREQVALEAWVGLYRAAERWDPGSGASFPTFSRYHVRGTLIEAVRQHGPASRRAYERWKEGGPEPPGVNLASLDAGDLDGRPWEEVLPDGAPAVHDLAFPEHREEGDPAETYLPRLPALLARLAPAEREMLEAWYVRQESAQEIAARAGLHRDTVRKHVKRVLDRLRQLAQSASCRQGGR
jgi:RNA polymerase sigma factor (sigma-70 family)